MTELHIPDKAIRATYSGTNTQSITNKTTIEVLELGAPFIVAAELLRLAGELERRADRVLLGRDGSGTERRATWLDAGGVLRTRATELDNGESVHEGQTWGEVDGDR